MKKNESLSFEERKKLVDLIGKYKKDKHRMHMKELEYQRESDRIHHDREMERQRIKTAEIRKAQERREWRNFHNENRG